MRNRSLLVKWRKHGIGGAKKESILVHIRIKYKILLKVQEAKSRLRIILPTAYNINSCWITGAASLSLASGQASQELGFFSLLFYEDEILPCLL